MVILILTTRKHHGAVRFPSVGQFDVIFCTKQQSKQRLLFVLWGLSGR